MESVIQNLKRYLLETLDIEIELKPWEGWKAFPFFLQDRFVFYSVSILDTECILAIARENWAMTPAAIRKHLLQIQLKIGMPCIYVNKLASTYNRKRLMRQDVQFVIPNYQVYLPALGIDWRNRYHLSQIQQTISKISPATQAVLIYALNNPGNQFNPLELAKVLNYTQMTMTRALNELELVGLGKSERKGKERWFSFITDPPLWKSAEPLMQNPIKKHYGLIDNIDEIEKKGVLAGLSALSEISMLSSPDRPIYAMSLQTWKELQKIGCFQEIHEDDEAEIEIEVWSYDPLLFAKKRIVDRFSLYLSLKENQDERIQTMLEKMIKDIL